MKKHGIPEQLNGKPCFIMNNKNPLSVPVMKRKEAERPFTHVRLHYQAADPADLMPTQKSTRKRTFGYFYRFCCSAQALRTESMWRVRSSILLEKPHSLSYQATSLTK